MAGEKPVWARFDVGDTLAWSSQGHGAMREKVGVVIGFVPALAPISALFPGIQNRKYDYDISIYDRYLVAVERPRTRLAIKARILDHYAPPRQVIDKRGRKVES